MVLLSLLLPLAGIKWDNPGLDRSRRVLSPDWDRAKLFDALASGWQDLYDKSRGATPLLAETGGKYATRLKGAVKVDFNKNLPPAFLFNSYRSMLIRSRYPDEALPLSDLAQMKPAQLNFRPPSFLYGGGYLYPLGAYYLALSKTGLIRRLPMRRMLEEPDALGRIYTAGRFLSALSFAGICLMCFFIARELSNFSAGALAFAAALTTPVLLTHSCYLLPHVWSTFWAMAFIFLFIKAMQAPHFDPFGKTAGQAQGLKLPVLSGVCLGISAGSYWSQLHILIFPAALLLSLGKGLLRKDVLVKAAAAAAGGALVFIMLNPYLLIEWRTALMEWKTASGADPGALHHAYPAKLAALFTKTLPRTIGITCTLAVIGGYIWGLLSGKPAVKSLAAACLIMALLVAPAIPADIPAWIRRFFPWLMVSLLLSAAALEALLSRLSGFWKAPLLILFLLPGSLMSFTYAYNFALASGPGSTFFRMADELDAMKPDGRLGLLEFPQPAYTPHFRLDRWPLLFVTAGGLASLGGREPPPYLLVTFHQKNSVLKVLDDKYELLRGFYPEQVLGFRIDPALSAANIPVELYKLKGPEK